MASYLRPRRGKKATAISQNIILKRGEIFFEVPDAGVGKGAGKLKMGDGSTPYSSLPYFMEPTSVDVATSAISFTESSTTANATLLNEIASGAQLKTIVGSIKKLLRNLNSSVTSLNNDLGNKSNSNHNHDGVYSKLNHSHNYLPTFDATLGGTTTINGNTYVNNGSLYFNNDGGIVCRSASSGNFNICANFSQSNRDMFLQAATIHFTNNNQYTRAVASAFVQGSALRFKENIRDIQEEEINKFEKLKVKIFDYKQDSPMEGKNICGLIADEVVKLFPNTVYYDKDGNIFGIDYSKLVPYIIAYILKDIT